MRYITALLLALGLTACVRTDEADKGRATEGSATRAHGEGHIEDAHVIELSLEAQRRAGIVVEPVRMSRVEALVKATGTIQPVDGRVVHVRPLARGRILKVLARVGDRVEKDQSLATFDNIEAGELASHVNSARAEVQRIVIQLSNARRQAERARNLLEIGAVPAKEFEAAEADAKALAESLRAQQSVLAGLETRLKRFGGASSDGVSASTIRAPFAGVVIQTEAAPGDVIDSSSILFTIADLSRVYVDAQVYEKDLGRIRLQQPVRITVDTYADATFEGRIVAIKDILNPQTRTAAVRCELANPANRLKLEMFANLAIPTQDSHEALSVSSDAVQTINRRQVVFVRNADLHFEAREVQALGDGARLEITAGLKEGEPIVVKGAFQLKSAFLAKELQSEHGHD